MIRYLLDRWPDVVFIHLEPFEYQVDHRASRCCRATSRTRRSTSWARAYGLGDATWPATDMPWVFVVDGNGVVRAKYTGIIGSADVDVIMSLIEAEHRRQLTGSRTGLLPGRPDQPPPGPPRLAMRYGGPMIPRRPGRPLGVGVQLPEVEREVRWPELRAIARTAEQAGFDSIWIGDHLLYRFASGETRGPWEAWTTLAGLAEATERVDDRPARRRDRVPRARSCSPSRRRRWTRSPVAGWSWASAPAGTTTEFAALGRAVRPPDQPVRGGVHDRPDAARARATIDFEGEFFTAREAELLPRPARPGGPPILVGSSGPRMLAATLPYVDAWNAWYADTGNSPGGRGRGSGRSWTRPRPRPGRDPAAIERTVAVQVRMPGGTGRIMGDTDPRMAVAAAGGLAGGDRGGAARLRARGHRPRPARGGPDHRGVRRRAGAGAGARWTAA